VRDRRGRFTVGPDTGRNLRGRPIGSKNRHPRMAYRCPGCGMRFGTEIRRHMKRAYLQNVAHDRLMQLRRPNRKGFKRGQ
jgi:hypothetical protein